MQLLDNDHRLIMKLKKLLGISLVAGLIIVPSFVWAANYSSYQPQTYKVVKPDGTVVDTLDDGADALRVAPVGAINEGYTDGVATTSTVTLTTSASSTISANIQSESFTFGFCAEGNSTASDLVFDTYFAYEAGSNPTWYQDTSASFDSATLVSRNGLSNIFELSQTASDPHCYDVVYQPVQRIKQVKITMGASGDSVDIHRVIR